MTKSKFNLNDPFERDIFERMKKVLKTNMSYDAVIEVIASDFPSLKRG